ncbi:hypothetical protein ZWY2020_027346 [Hordeum vulgare]|nr:hypothetical protein ZWY2020_027346 [Hordeum vulgare]
MEKGERDDDFLKVLRAPRDAARTVEDGHDGSSLLAGDPELHALCRLLATVMTLYWCAYEEVEGSSGGVVGGPRALCRWCKARRGIAHAAGGVATKIQA